MNDQRRRAEFFRMLLAGWLPGLLLIGAAVIISISSDVTLRMLMQDTTTVLLAPFYIGGLSLLGIILWSICVAICLFAALATSIDAEWRRFLLAAGVLSAVLLFDDAYLLHDEILPIHLGIPGELFGVLYLVAIVALVIRFRALIATSNYLIFGAALVLFSAAAAIDVASTVLSEMVPSNAVVLGEDGTKLLGIVAWLAYFASAGRQALAERAPAPA
jgi:hypothetical protein